MKVSEPWNLATRISFTTFTARSLKIFNFCKHLLLQQGGGQITNSRISAMSRHWILLARVVFLPCLDFLVHLIPALSCFRFFPVTCAPVFLLAGRGTPRCSSPVHVGSTTGVWCTHPSSSTGQGSSSVSDSVSVSSHEFSTKVSSEHSLSMPEASAIV